MIDARLEDLLRELTPQVLGALVRRYGHFDSCEDAVQEALLAAAQQWPEQGYPDSPRAWLIQVGSRRLTDLLRSDQSRRRREERIFEQELYDAPSAPESDDTLVLLFLCCHPALAPAAQIALTLRAVGGLTTEEIAAAFLVPEQTMRKRITRAKQSIGDSGVPFRMPPAAEQAARLDAVLHVLYLIFNEGYTATSGPESIREELSGEAIRLTRMLHRLLPADGEVAGLLALMLLTDARRPARLTDGELVPLAEQDRGRWDTTLIAEGVEMVTAAMTSGTLGPYQLQAAIAAVHDEAAVAEDTDWAQILALYDLLRQLSDNPLVSLNRAVAVAMTRGPRAGLDELAALATDKRLSGHHRLHAARAHLLELAGDTTSAYDVYREAARLTTSLPERRHLESRALRLRS